MSAEKFKQSFQIGELVHLTDAPLQGRSANQLRDYYLSLYGHASFKVVEVNEEGVRVALLDGEYTTFPFSFVLPTSLKAAVIRKGTAYDAATIFEFICELAEFEKARNEVKLQQYNIQITLSQKPAVVQCLIIDVGGVPAGFAWVYPKYSTWQRTLHLEDLYIAVEYRGQGFGTQLLRAVAKLAQEQNYGRLDWEVLSWNKDAIALYSSIGAQHRTEWQPWRMNADVISTFAEIK